MQIVYYNLKRIKLHIINVSQDIEFLEDTFMHKGVKSPCATCKTDYGIAWVNQHGVYLYDGQKVRNLLERNGRQIIKESDWSTFAANDPMIGYFPLKRQLLVVDDNTSTGTGAIYFYDMVTQSWVQGDDATFTSGNLTNFINDWDGNLVHAHSTGTIQQWSDTASARTSSTAFVSTKDIDFGYPSQRKKIYKVYVSYKGDGTNVSAKYGKDGLVPATNFASATFSNVGVTDWAVKELTFTTPSDVSNVKSLRVSIGGISASDFEIGDIAIIYRLKHVK